MASALLVTDEVNQGFLAERQRRRTLEARCDEFEQWHLAAVETLAAVVEAKDCYTRAHLERTHDSAVALAGRIDPALASDAELGYGFLLHDVGKIAIPESVLGKPGPLTEAEWVLMRTHPQLGVDLCADLAFIGKGVDVIRHHHEHWDGAGYPDGLRGEAIPLGARIFAVADSFDALTSVRPYRQALPLAAAIDELVAHAGTQFDPQVVAAFLDLVETSQLGAPTDRR